MNNRHNNYLDYIQQGKTYEEIRALAKKEGLEGAALSQLMRELDGRILKENEKRALKKQAQEWMWVGLAFCLIASIMFLYSFFDPESVYIYLVYGIFMGGVLVFLGGWQRRKVDEEEDSDF